MNSLLSLHGRLGSVGTLGQAAEALNTAYSGLANLTPVAGWGMIKRNPSYAGFALRMLRHRARLPISPLMPTNG
jgi:hypothetical protein